MYDSSFQKRDIRLLDPCAGYGDRLLGAIASGMVSQYVGVDPNVALHDGYRQIMADFGWRLDQVELLAEPFEDVRRDFSDQFDLVFTSPPFWTTEIYEENNYPNNHQSTTRYKQLDHWLHRFLWPLLRRCYLALRPGGYMVIHLQNVYTLNAQLVETTLNHMREGFLGAIGFGKRRLERPSEFLYVQPLWVWQRPRH
jgi:SAM-dependent methyltransferase